MKIFLAILTIAAVSLAGGNAWAHGNSGSSSAPAVSGGHHGGGSSAPAATTSASGPRYSGGSMPHYARSGQMPYRPTVTYHNGTKTLNYPGVKGSTVYHSKPVNLSNANNARTLQRAGGNFQTNSRSTSRHSQLNTTTNSQRTGDLRSGPNSQRTAAMNIASKKGNHLDPQTSARLRNYHGNVSSTAQAHQNHWNNCHHHHNHDWWHNHCVAFIFWDWGWWGWWDGWWYPAWGYDPYSYYGYNEPIYGYGDLSPEQIVASVQVALQQQGYYQYEIDGQMGPMTREAIARYQRDHRLPITYGIDQPTLGALGIIH